MNKITIYLLGTNHVSPSSKNKIETLIKKIEFDCFISEGVSNKGSLNIKNLIKEPTVLLCSFLWFKFLKLYQKDVPTLVKLSKEKNIPIYWIDKSIYEIIDEEHRWYDYLVLLFLFVFFYYLLDYSLIIVFLVSIFFYFVYFVFLKINKKRESNWINNISNILKNKKYENILLICGKYHSKRVNEKLSKIGFKVIDY